MSTISAALRRERKRAGLSLTEVAARAKIAKSTLSQLEGGAGNPSVETLWALSTALGVSLTELIAPSTAGTVLIRAGEGTQVMAEASNYRATLLAPAAPGVRRDVYVVNVEPGRPRVSEAHTAGEIEHLVLCSGSAKVGPVEAPVELSPGDYICYAGDTPHLFEALEPNTFAVLVSEHR
ncbi:helix-turn-helix domain-containing protein [Pseudarthrobacter sp. NPDC058119]|uniref:helix-turn-helix domain-containing protein n=1 Tax=Pseudarthrobacter sp. NPDC058119 TaxID=3346348 RepID=UPI0036DEF27F